MWWTLSTVCDQLAGLDVDALQHAEVERALQEVQRATNRLAAVRARLAGTVASRRRSRPAGTGPQPVPPPVDAGASDPGDRDATELLTGQLHVSPQDAARAVRTGRLLRDAPRTAAAFDAGELSEAQAAIICRTLTELPRHHRAEAERRLVELAATSTPQVLGRAARQLVGELDQASLERAAKLDHTRRRAWWRRADDGALVGGFTLYGLQAEQAETALRAATDPRSPSDRRSDEQRRADAVARLADIALRATELPARHGTPPQVLVSITAEQLAERRGTATLGSRTPIPVSQLSEVLDDCQLTRIVTDAKAAPLEGAVGTRTVPVALARALHVRDRHCTWAGCDTPAVWCHIAHGATPHAAGGRLSPDNAALLCPRHHRRFDAGGWRMHVDGPDVTYVRDPERPSATVLARQHRDRQAAATTDGRHGAELGSHRSAEDGRDGAGDGSHSSADDGSTPALGQLTLDQPATAAPADTPTDQARRRDREARGSPG